MFKNRPTKEEMKAMLFKNIEEGYIKETGVEFYSLTNKGMGKLTELLLDFVDIMREVESYKTYEKEYLIMVATESMLTTFGSKLQSFIALYNTDWKKDLKGQLEMPIEDLMRENGITEEDLNNIGLSKEDIMPKKKEEPPDEMDKESNVFTLKNKKNDTIH